MKYFVSILLACILLLGYLYYSLNKKYDKLAKTYNNSYGKRVDKLRDSFPNIYQNKNFRFSEPILDTNRLKLEVDTFYTSLTSQTRNRYFVSYNVGTILNYLIDTLPGLLTKLKYDSSKYNIELGFYPKQHQIKGKETIDFAVIPSLIPTNSSSGGGGLNYFNFQYRSMYTNELKAYNFGDRHP